MRSLVRGVVMLFLVASTAVIAGQGEPATSRVPDAVVFAARAERAWIGDLRKDLAPLVEAVFQNHTREEPLGYVAESDAYLLGRYLWKGRATVEPLVASGGASIAQAEPPTQAFADALASLMTPDWNLLDGERYEYIDRGATYLGDVRTLVFDIKPRRAGAGWWGRIWIEDKTYHVVRYAGMTDTVQAAFAAYLKPDAAFRIDVSRALAAEDRWLTAYAYVEEVPALDAPRGPRLRGQIRWWGYDTTSTRLQQPFSAIVINRAAPVWRPAPKGPSPRLSARQFEREAEANVLARLTRARFMGPSGAVERAVEQVVTNLLVSAKVQLGFTPKVRILLTSRLESFTVGQTIAISRGVLDTVPTESALALVLAHHLGHYVNGDETIDRKFTFADLLDVSDLDLLRKLRFRHSDAEEEAADARALEILKQSPYSATATDGGLFLQAIERNVSRLIGLIEPILGEELVDLHRAAQGSRLFRTEPVMNPASVTQDAALPLGSKILVHPLDGRTDFYQSDPIAVPLVREKAPLGVTPFMPHLVDAEVSSPVSNPVRKPAATN
jgi:hypothetical protein